MLAVEKKLLKVVPDEFKVDVHHWLILHGRYTCIARKPSLRCLNRYTYSRCGACLIEDLCEFKDKNRILKTIGDNMTTHTERQTWSSRLTYVLTVAGATVGFGATWRFPYLVGGKRWRCLCITVLHRNE